MRLAILSTHPIQYYAPLFRALHKGPLDIHVFYGWEGMATAEATDHGFGAKVKWDIPLLDGYPHTFLENRSKDPGTHHFRGIDSIDVIDRITAWAPDALLVFGWNYASHLRALRHFHGRIPVLFRGDSTLIDEVPGPRTWLRRIVLKWIYRHVDAALYVGRHNRKYFKRHGLRDEQLFWAPYAIENERFMADADAREAEALSWRRELGIKDHDRVVLFVGKLEDKKNPALLLEAFRGVGSDRTHLILGGTGPLEEPLRDASREMSNVHFIGFQNQSPMPVVYRLGDVIVLPSRARCEPWGLPVNAARALFSDMAVKEIQHFGVQPEIVLFLVEAMFLAILDNHAFRLVAGGFERLRHSLGVFRRATRIARASGEVDRQFQLVCEIDR